MGLTERIGRVCVFDKKKDYKKVESGLAMSISDALRTGVVKEGTSSLESNGIDDPEAVLGRVSDRFDAIEAERAIRKYGKKAQVAAPMSEPPKPAVVAPPAATE